MTFSYCELAELHEFEYGELIEATKSFSRESIIHDRGYGEALMRKFETPFDTTHWVIFCCTK